jgi:pimeloyl-ACP methyl ester carboxylesterase
MEWTESSICVTRHHQERSVSDTYVLVHGAWHSGILLEPVAEHLRAAGHACHCPTLAGNRPDDDRATTGLQDAVQSVVDYFEEHDLAEVRLVAHSYGGMVISRVAAIIPERIRRLVYHNAFVPSDGQCLNDLVPRFYVEAFDPIAEANDGAVMLPFPIWREVFINDADLEQAESTYRQLNPQPYRTFTDRISLETPLAALEIGKAYLNFQQDAVMPHSYPWHPRMSETLGLFRLVEATGSHEVCFTNPSLLAHKIEEAGRD